MKTNREQTAIAVLAMGGYFRKALESVRVGRGGSIRKEQFRTRLYTATGRVVPGVAFQTHYALERRGILAHRECTSSSVWPQEWSLAVG